MNKDLCNKCGACCKYIQFDNINKVLYWDSEILPDEDFISMLVPVNCDTGIYTCKYLKNNLCTNKNKPNICKEYPSDPFAQIPDSCDYSGELFIKREKIKQKIRKLKEEIIYYNAIINTISNKKEQQQINRIIEAHNRIINKYKKYGSGNW